MRILIIEDEVKTARALSQLILYIKPGAVIPAPIQSVATAISWLNTNEQPDLIFMDIQLSDGLSFEIFRSVKVAAPVIFCTAFDEYALEAFRANGIAYLLKPFSKESISAALDKVDELKRFFGHADNQLATIEALLARVNVPQGKESFLVFKNNKYITVKTVDIAYFNIRNELPTLVTFDQQEYNVSQSLDELHKLLSARQFFRLNRQYLINFSAVKEVEHYFARKLYVKLTIPTAEKLLVGKDKVTAVLNWLENR